MTKETDKVYPVPITAILLTTPTTVRDFALEYNKLASARGGLTPIDFHKHKLGEQTRCYVSGSEQRRHYIWEFDNWQVWVHNVAGVTIMAPFSLSQKEAWAIWDQYKEKVK